MGDILISSVSFGVFSRFEVPKEYNEKQEMFKGSKRVYKGLFKGVSNNDLFACLYGRLNLVLLGTVSPVKQFPPPNCTIFPSQVTQLVCFVR